MPGEHQRLDDFTFVGRFGTEWTIGKAGVTAVRNRNSAFAPLDLSKLPYRPGSFEDALGSLWLGEHRVHRVITDGWLRKQPSVNGIMAVQEHLEGSLS